MIIDELPPDIMRDVIGRLDARDRSRLSKVSRELRQQTIAALTPREKLWLAVKVGNVELLKIAMEEGIDVNTTVKNGVPPLHLSASNGHPEVARVLIEAGADVNAKIDPKIAHARPFNRETPLHLSIKRGYPEVVQVLINAGADVNIRTGGFHDETPLHISRSHLMYDDPKMRHIYLEITRVLIEAGAKSSGLF